MKRNKTIDLIQYLSLALVLSYFILYNIYMVIIGVIIAIYSINKDLIYDLIKIFKIKIGIRNKIDDKISTYKQPISLLTSNIDYLVIETTNKDSKLSLVEKVEQSGYIPSLDKE